MAEGLHGATLPRGGAAGSVLCQRSLRVMEGYREYGNAGTADREVAAVRAIYEAFARRDVEAALPYINEDCVMQPAGTASLIGREGGYRGRDGVREYFADAARVWDELTLHADDIRVAAGGVVVFGHVEGRANGQEFRSQVLWTWQVRDGQAVSMRVSNLG